MTQATGKMSHLLSTLAWPALAMLPALAAATIFVQRPLQDQVKETPAIVRGTIGSSYTAWASEDSSKRIYTFYQLDVSETLKGDGPKGRITIRELGGEKDGVGMQVAGAAHFTRGEDVVVFLDDANSDGSYDVHGLSSGKLDISRRPDGAECLSGVAVSEAGADGFVHPDEEPAPDAGCVWTVKSLRQAIRDLGEAPAKGVEPKPASPPRPSRLTVRPGVSPAPPPAAAATPRAAFQLQPSAAEERGFFNRGRLWIWVLVIGTAGLIFLLLNPRR